MKKFILSLVLSTFFVSYLSTGHIVQACEMPSLKMVNYYGNNLGISTKKSIDSRIDKLFEKVESKYTSTDTQSSVYKAVAARITGLENQSVVKQNKGLVTTLSYIKERLLYKSDAIISQEECLIKNVFEFDETSILQDQEIDEEDEVGKISVFFDGERTVKWLGGSSAKSYKVKIGSYTTTVYRNYYKIGSRVDVGNYDAEWSDVTVDAYDSNGGIIASGKTQISYQGNHCKYIDENMSTDVYHTQKKYSYLTKRIDGGVLKYRKNFMCEYGNIVDLKKSHESIVCDSGYTSRNNQCDKNQPSSAQEYGDCLHKSGNTIREGKQGGYQEVITVGNGKKHAFVEYSCVNGKLIEDKSTLQKLLCNSGYVGVDGLCQKINTAKKSCSFTDSKGTTTLYDKEEKWVPEYVGIKNGMRRFHVLMNCNDGRLTEKREITLYITCNKGYYSKWQSCYKKEESTQKIFTFTGPKQVIKGKPFTVEWKAAGYKYCIGYGLDLQSTDAGKWTQLTDLGNKTSIQGRYSSQGSRQMVSNNTGNHTLGLQCYTDDFTSDNKQIQVQVVEEIVPKVEVDAFVRDTFGVNDNQARIEFRVSQASSEVEKIEIIEIEMDGSNTIRNDDNENVSYPEIIQNGDEWYVKATGSGQHILKSYTFKATFEQDPSSTEYIAPVTAKAMVNLDLGTYSDD